MNSRLAGYVVGASVILVMAGCVTRPNAPAAQQTPAAPAQPTAAAVTCSPPSQPQLVGTWLASSNPKGVGGQLMSLMTLRADGTMAFDTQLKIGKRPRPALKETGCWSVANGVLTQQTLKSYGDEVDISDPIYRTTYRIEKVEASRLILRETQPGGAVLTARKMSDGYRLPSH